MGCFWDLLVIISVALLVLKPTVEGLLTPTAAAGFLVALVILRALGRVFGKGIGRAVRFAFSIGVPLVGLALYAVSLGHGNIKDSLTILGSVGALIFSLMGLYIIFRGLSP